MKNIKNVMTAITLAATLAFGSVSANAGMLISDRSGAGTTCTANDTSILSQAMGIIIVGLTSSATGIIIVGRSGLMITDRPANGCVADQSRTGLMIVD